MIHNMTEVVMTHNLQVILFHDVKQNKRYCCPGTDICFTPESASWKISPNGVKTTIVIDLPCQGGCECEHEYYRNTLTGE